MTIAYFIMFHHADPAVRLHDDERARVVDLVGATPRLVKGLVFTPATARAPISWRQHPLSDGDADRRAGA